MQILSLVSLYCKSVIASSHSTDENLCLVNINGDDLIFEKMPKFKLNKDEADLYWNAFKKIYENNERLIKHITNLQNIDEYNGFCPDFQSHLKNLIDNITKLRKDSENDITCYYEFLKFCEYFYLTLFYIIENQHALLFEFVQFLFNTILPVLKKIRQFSKFCNTILSNIHSNAEISRKNCEEIPESIRHLFMLSFCTKYLIKAENKSLTLDQDRYNHIIQNFTLNDCLSLFLNIYTRFFLLDNIRIRVRFDKHILHSKYPISGLFKDLLFYNSIFTNESAYARSKLNMFLLKKISILKNNF